MIRSKIIILLLVISTFSFANESFYFYADNEHKIKKKYREFNAIRISLENKCETGPCLAYQYASGQLRLPPFQSIKTGGRNPASILCEEIKGKAVIGYFPSRDEFSLCLFKDQSYLFGQDLLRMYK